MEGVSEREYAARSGLSRGATQKARKAGCLVVYGDGSINTATSDTRRAAMTDPDQQRCSVGGDSGFEGVVLQFEVATKFDAKASATRATSWPDLCGWEK